MSPDDIVDPKRNNFGLVRLVAALCVLFSHAQFITTGRHADQLLVGVSFYTLGDHAVNVFFVVSGLLLSASLARTPSMIDFVVARALRIFPALIVCTLILALVLGPLVTTLPALTYFSHSGVLQFIGLTASTALGSTTLPGVFANNPASPIVDGPVWSLKYEITCYVILAFVTASSLVATTRRFVLFILASWATCSVILVAHFNDMGTPLDNMLRLWLAFSIGMALHRFHRHIPVALSIAVVLLAGWAIALGTPLERAVSPFVMAYVVLWFALLPLGPLRRFTNKVDLSYGIYIFSWPIGQTLAWGWPGLPLWANLTLAVLLTLVAASLSWFLVEKPAISHRRAVAAWLKARLRPNPLEGSGKPETPPV